MVAGKDIMGWRKNVYWLLGDSLYPHIVDVVLDMDQHLVRPCFPGQLGHCDQYMSIMI